ncbi:MAG: hypothetical protein DWQ19_12125 [Crenarchaeota archaeon]|nr:MAG: hypothetical protein DWQ19_12125 [Thermoproteota archaeon]
MVNLNIFLDENTCSCRAHRRLALQRS